MDEEEIIKKLEMLIWEFQKLPEHTVPTTNNEEIYAIKRNFKFIQKRKRKE